MGEEDGEEKKEEEEEEGTNSISHNLLNTEQLKPQVTFVFLSCCWS